MREIRVAQRRSSPSTKERSGTEVTPKSLARVFVLTVALACALAVLGAVFSAGWAALIVVVVNGAVVSWLRWHEEQHPANNH